MASSIPLLKFSGRKNNGQALVGGKLYTYRAGTNIAQDTYTTPAGDIANSNPIILDSRGEADVYLGISAYKFVLYDSLDNLQYEVDDIANGGVNASLQTVSTLDDLRNLPGGSSNYVYVASYASISDGGEGFFSWSPLADYADDDGICITPSSEPTTGRWLRQFSGKVNVRWFGCNGRGADDYSALLNAIGSAVNFSYDDIIIPDGYYTINSDVTFPASKNLEVQGYIDGTGTVTISGGFEAAEKEVFGSSLNVRFGNPKATPINAIWFASFTKCIQAFSSLPGTLIVNKNVTLTSTTNLINIDIKSSNNAMFTGSAVLNVSGSVDVGLTQWIGPNVSATFHKAIELPVDWFGAKGDGVNNDAPPIQAALSSAGRKRVGVVVIDNARVYRCDSGLEIPSGVWLKGTGKRLGGLKFYHEDGNPSINFQNGYYQQLSDLNIDHNNVTSAAQGLLLRDNDGAFGTDPPQYPIVRNIKIWRHQTGIRVQNEVTWALFEDVNIEFCDVAYSLSNANLTHFLRCIANANGTAWYIEDASKCVLTHCTAQVCSSTTVPAIQIVDSTGVTIENLWCERNESTCVLVKGSSTSAASRFTRISECWLNGAGFTSPNTGWGLDIGANCIETTVDGGRFGGNATGDIRINVDSSGNIIRQPHSISALEITDNATDTQYWDYTKFVINPESKFRNVVNIVRSDLGVTTSAGIDLKNETVAESGAPQVSPSLGFRGAGWKTNATAASQSVEMRAYLVPVEGAAAPTGYLVVQRSVNGGTWGEVARFNPQSLLIASNAATDLGNPFYMQVSRDGTVGYAASRYSNDSSTAPTFTGRSAQGSFAVQAASLNANPLVALDGHGHDATSIKTTPSARIIARAIETWSGSGNGTEWLIQTTPSGSTTMATVATIRNTGITFAVPVNRSSQTGITASTTQTQGQGPLTTDINIVSTVANTNDTVTLPTAVAGSSVFIRNNGANTLRIYPASGDNVNGTGMNSPVTLAAGASVTYHTADTTNWYS